MPVRTARIDINTGQPKDLPTGTDFGGTFNATDPLIQKIFPGTSSATGSEIQNIVAATKQTGSCGSCHIGEAAGKAGQQINFNVGGEVAATPTSSEISSPVVGPSRSSPSCATNPSSPVTHWWTRFRL
jgi:hypothetical protein